MSGKVLAWCLGTAVIAGMLGVLMFQPEAMESLPIERTVFLPGATTDGHYQIELDCDACHTQSFSDMTTMQDACVECHGAELEGVDDSHPRPKFTDPRNADRVAVLDARWCVTCHQEHRPEVTATMGLSLPGDYCYRCHEGIGEDRPTHEGLAFDSCASGGCHNFHDNRALYEDFLVEHRAAPPHVIPASMPLRDLRAGSDARGFAKRTPLAANDHDAPAGLAELDRWVDEWAGTAHAEAGINCGDCHAPDGAAWVDAPTIAACESCHAKESAGFGAGRHGMRLTAGLGPMTPALARIPMHDDVGERELDCNACHGAHAYDTRHAAVDACLECHADEHTEAYRASAHFTLWQREGDGTAVPGSGVSCATCHLPRVVDADAGRTVVAHNQNDFLRPNEKMIRPVCMQCHGLGFSLDSLADPALVAANFRGQPSRKVESIHYASVLRWDLEGRTPPWKEEGKEE